MNSQQGCFRFGSPKGLNDGEGLSFPLALITEDRRTVWRQEAVTVASNGFRPSWAGWFSCTALTYIYTWHLHDRGFQRPRTHPGVWNGCWPLTDSPRQPLYKLQRQAFQRERSRGWENLKQPRWLCCEALSLRARAERWEAGQPLPVYFHPPVLSVTPSSLWRFAPRAALFYFSSASFLLSERVWGSLLWQKCRNIVDHWRRAGSGSSNALAIDATITESVLSEARFCRVRQGCISRLEEQCMLCRGKVAGGMASFISGTCLCAYFII